MIDQAWAKIHNLLNLTVQLKVFSLVLVTDSILSTIDIKLPGS